MGIGTTATSFEQYFGSSCIVAAFAGIEVLTAIAATFVGHKVPTEVAEMAGHKVLAAIVSSFKFTIVPSSAKSDLV